MTPLSRRWERPEVVATLSATSPNDKLMQFAEKELGRSIDPCLLDIGCGAGCNAVPLAGRGWNVLGLDLSEPMLEAARRRAQQEGLTERLRFQSAPMDQLPVADQSFDFIVAHGIWNLARSVAEFRTAVSEAARVARSGAPLFVFTFSRNTLPEDAEPVLGEQFVFTQFAGEPQCFLTEVQLVEELEAVGFIREPGESITEYNRKKRGELLAGGAPVLYEGIFRRC